MVSTLEKNLRRRKNRSPLLGSRGKMGAVIGCACSKNIERELDISAAEEMMLLTYKEEIRKKIMDRIKSL